MKTLIESRAPRHAFTLVEMMVALAILGLLLTVIMIPLKASFDSFHLGKSRSDNQAAAQVTLDDIERDLRRAVYVFPNSALSGVTDKAPYTSNNSLPYTKSVDATDIFDNTTDPRYTPKAGVCGPYDATPSSMSWANTSRIDMLIADTDANGKLVNPINPGATIVTYYARRLNVDQPYSSSNNPVVLFRAEFPYRTSPSAGNAQDVDKDLNPIVPAPTPTPAFYNADISNSRYPGVACTASAAQNRSAIWLAHNYYGEANLEPLCRDLVPSATVNTDLVGGAHTVVMPRGVSLVVPRGYLVDVDDPHISTVPTPVPSANDANLVPDTTFGLSDTNGDGRIDHVDISLDINNFDASNSTTLRNGHPTGQSYRTARSVDLPNVNAAKNAANLQDIH